MSSFTQKYGFFLAIALVAGGVYCRANNGAVLAATKTAPTAIDAVVVLEQVGRDLVRGRGGAADVLDVGALADQPVPGPGERAAQQQRRGDRDDRLQRHRADVAAGP